MINDDSCMIHTQASDGVVVTSAAAISLGLIVTELVINALKHAFPVARPECVIEVAYEINGEDWKLTVADNGGGKVASVAVPARIGLGTSIVQALASQLDAKVETISGATGTIVSISHSEANLLPVAA
jgi:chemotaxis protein methyltransferase CheR